MQGSLTKQFKLIRINDQNLKIIHSHKNMTELSKDELKKLIFGEIVQCKAGGDVSLKNRQLYMEMTCHMIEQLTPKEFSQIFPITKEFKNWKFGIRDYFDTVEFIEKIGWDKKIPDAFEFMMNYWNTEVLEYTIKIMDIVSDSRQRQTGKSVMQEFLEQEGVI